MNKINGSTNIKSIAVIGAGIMGDGIAQNFAQAGLRVHVFDINRESLQRCERQIASNLEEFKEFQLLTESTKQIRSRVSFHLNSDLEKVVQDCQLVVEAMPEIIELKQELFGKLDILPPEIILASNTSSMTISDIGQSMKTAERLIGMHYFNPAHIIPAVEVHCGEATSKNTIDKTIALLKQVGKQPVLVKKEIPGFIINRLTGAMEREVDLLLDSGVVSPEDLDIAVKASYGFRLACLGPMEAEDMIGLDTAARASNNIFPQLSNASEASPNLIAKVTKGELGIKSGKGWYDYPEEHREQIIAKNNRRLLRQLKLFNTQD